MIEVDNINIIIDDLLKEENPDNLDIPNEQIRYKIDEEEHTQLSVKIIKLFNYIYYNKNKLINELKIYNKKEDVLNPLGMDNIKDLDILDNVQNKKTDENLDKTINIKENIKSPTHDKLSNFQNNIVNNNNDTNIEEKKVIMENVKDISVNKKTNKYTLENAIKMFKETIKINDNFEINEEINDDIDFKIVLEDIYINQFNKIELYSKLYDYIEENNEIYINEINKTYKIDTPDKKKKLNLKTRRCHQFIKSLKKIDEDDNMVKTIFTPTFLINLKKDDFNSLTNYIENYIKR